jgi:hypothetical protein
VLSILLGLFAGLVAAVKKSWDNPLKGSALSGGVVLTGNMYHPEESRSPSLV